MRVKETEFEIQAYLYCSLRRLGYVIRGEMLFELPEHARTTPTRRKARLDLCQLIDGRLAAIIEVKRYRATKEAFMKTKQYSKYKSLGVDLFLIGGMPAAIKFVEKIEARGYLSTVSRKS